MKKILAVTALFSALAFAQGPMGRGMGRGLGPGPADNAGPQAAPTFDQLKAYLGLTPDQVTKLQANRQAEVDANRATLQQVRDKEQALRTLMQQTSPNPLEVGNLMVEIKNLRAQVGQSDDKYQAEALKILTADQVKKLQVLADAQKLAPVIHEAMMLNLLDRPAPGNGVGPLGPGPMRGGVGMMMRRP